MNRADLELLMAPGAVQSDAFVQAVTRRPEWHARASCRGMGTALFFPDRGEATARPAVAICVVCPVRAECLAFGLIHAKTSGVWGGATVMERRKIATMAKGPRTKQALSDVEPVTFPGT